MRRLIAAALERFGRLDILHNNVGASLALGDATATELTEEAFQRSFDVNLKGMWLDREHLLDGGPQRVPARRLQDHEGGGGGADREPRRGTGWDVAYAALYLGEGVSWGS